MSVSRIVKKIIMEIKKYLRRIFESREKRAQRALGTLPPKWLRCPACLGYGILYGCSKCKDKGKIKNVEQKLQI